VQTAPTVVKYAQENGIDLTTLTGTGARNRITRDDVLKAIQSNAAPVTLPASAAPDQVIANARVSLKRNKAGLVKLDAAIADARAKA
ncbi:E3 binding domain-containing protein, partial [Collinsella tanakaei]|uniref:E3 binding domain-containing protein n=1 Tax=Collinsella tanakaei TaxID=626935 RepID=UPI0019588C65